jgi:hypothetical protein
MKKQYVRFVGRLVALFAMVLSTGLMLGSVAHAQEDEAPLRLAHINTAGETGTHSFNALQGILKQSDQIILVPQTTFMAGASRYGLEMSVFRRGSDREANAEVFKKLMAELEIEGLIIQDVFGRNGSTLQLVIIGPRGFELADIRREARRGRVSNDDTVAMLRESFAALVPDVRGYRREQEEARQRELEAQRQRELEAQRRMEEEQVSIRDEAVARHRSSAGYLEPSYSLHAGAMMGQRLMRLASPDSFPFNHNTPFVGIGGQLDAVVAVFEGGKSGFGLSIFGGYAPFQTQFNDDLLPSTFARLGLDLQYLRGLSSEFFFRLYAGAEAKSVTLAPNELYTGHRYVLGRAGLGVTYLFGTVGALHIGGGVLPVISADNSAGGFGEIETDLGYGGSARLNINMGESLSLGLDYTFQLNTLRYPVAPGRSEPAHSRDMFHLGILSLGYRM